MSRKHVPTYYVLRSYEICTENRKKTELPKKTLYPYELLSAWTNECEKVCYRAMEREDKNGYITFGTTLRTGWLTRKGKEYLKKYKEGAE